MSICIYEKYSSNEKNKIIIKKEYDKIGNQRKIDNSRTIRRLIENKRINACKQLIEKWQQPDKYIGRRIDGNYYKLFHKNASQDDISKRKNNMNNKYGISDELMGFIDFED